LQHLLKFNKQQTLNLNQEDLLEIHKNQSPLRQNIEQQCKILQDQLQPLLTQEQDQLNLSIIPQLQQQLQQIPKYLDNL